MCVCVEGLEFVVMQSSLFRNITVPYPTESAMPRL